MPRIDSEAILLEQTQNLAGSVRDDKLCHAAAGKFLQLLGPLEGEPLL